MREFSLPALTVMCWGSMTISLEYENLDELNHLACLLSELDQGDLEKFEAVIDSGEHTSSVADLINLAQNLDCYEFYPGVEDDETLGPHLCGGYGRPLTFPDHLLPYFDYEAYGRDVRINEDSHFAPGGYVLNNGGKFIEHYHGIEDIPAEHKGFCFSAAFGAGADGGLQRNY